MQGLTGTLRTPHLKGPNFREARGLSALARFALAFALPLARKTMGGLMTHLAASPAGSKLPPLSLVARIIGGLVTLVALVVAVRVALCAECSLSVT